MTYYELFQLGPAVYMPVLLISLGITLLAYGIFPIVFAKVRKKTITKKKYTLLCYGVNFFVMFLFLVFNGKSSGAPYILWTGVFLSIGLRTLKKRSVLEGGQTLAYPKEKSFPVTTKETSKVQFNANTIGIQSFTVVTYDTSTGKMYTEMREVDTLKYPLAEFAVDNIYYSIVYTEDWGKVRKYYTKKYWETIAIPKVSPKENIQEKQPIQTISVVEPNGFNDRKTNKKKAKYCSRCGSLIDKHTKQCTGCGKKYFKGIRFNKILVTVLAFSLVLLVAIGIIIYQYNEINSMKEEIWDASFELSFFRESAVIVPNDNSNTYHKYGCSKLSYYDTGFWVFNPEAAQGYGYKQYGLCH